MYMRMFMCCVLVFLASCSGKVKYHSPSSGTSGAKGALAESLTAKKCAELFDQAIEKKSSSLSQGVQSKRDSIDCRPMKFKYFIVSNFMPSSESRYIKIFMDERAFSRDNLELLFTIISETYPNPFNLTIVVETNWEQFSYSLPPECPGMGISGGEHHGFDPFDYHEALFHRRAKKHGRAEKKLFRFNPKLEEKKNVVVNMK